MRFNVNKITSVTLLTSMILTSVSPPLSTAVYAAGMEQTEAVNEECTEESTVLQETELSVLPESILLAASAEEIAVTAETEENRENAEAAAATDTSTVSETQTDHTEEASNQQAAEPDTESAEQSEANTDSHPEQNEDLNNTNQTEPVNTQDSASGSNQTEASSNETNAETDENQSTENQIGSEQQPLAGNEENQDYTETPATDETDMTENVAVTETGTETEMETEKPDLSNTLEAKIEVRMAEAVSDAEDPRAAGNPQVLKIQAANQSDENAYLRIYLWDYEGEEKDASRITNEALTDPCEEIEIIECGEEQQFSMYLISNSGEEQVETAYLKGEYEAGKLEYRYLEVEVPSHYSLTNSVQIVNNEAEQVVLYPVFQVDEDEYEQDKCLVFWNEKSEAAEEMTEALSEAAMEEETETVSEEQTEETQDIQEVSENLKEEKAQETAHTAASLSLDIPSELSKSEFSSKRLLVKLSDQSKFLEKENILETYDDICLIEYDTVEICMAAYVYYTGFAEAVEPDSYIEIASDRNTDDSEALSATEGALVVSDGITRVIALLDTGAAASENVTERVSMIDDIYEGHYHGNNMVSAITSQNPNAQILSVRVIGNDGRGTVSSIIAGMEYAMSRGVSIINLSLSSRASEKNALIAEEIRKAAAMGIMVVGAAGNNGADVMNFMPGSVSEAYIIGACNTSGIRIASSNYGATVDYNVVAGTTSEAAAKFSGYLSLAGVGALKINDGTVYSTSYVAGDGQDPDETEAEQETDRELTEEELSDMAGTEDEGEYPGRGSSISDTVKIWLRDTEYDFTAYTPYKDDPNVSVSCVSELPDYVHQAGEEIEMEYECSLVNEENYFWSLFVTFVLVEDRSLVAEGSDLLAQLMPAAVNQERNAGYGGIVPNKVGETVEGRDFNVLKGDESFDVHGLLIDYNPETFKVNNLTDDGGFDVNTTGSYTVIYEMSYFLYPEYTWFVANKVHVIDREELSEAVIFSMYRPGYESAKFFFGGGWANGEDHNLEELAIDQLSEDEVERLEDSVLGRIDEDDEEYMEIAETWTTVESANISGRITTGSGNTTNHSWVSGSMSACNYGTAQVSEKKKEIAKWISDKGYDIDTSSLTNYSVSCCSGHDYLGLWPDSSYSTTFRCYIQKNGKNYRLKIECSLQPGSDSHGNYQGFYGSCVYSSLTDGARLRIYKRFHDPAFMDVNPERYGYINTTFAIYPASAYNKTTGVLDTTGKPEGTIILKDKEDDTVYGDSDILDSGTYYVIETRRIKGCTLNKDIYGPVVIKNSDTGVIKLHEKVNNADYPSMGSNNWIYNDPMYFNGNILTKVDDTGLPIAGAIYRVQYSGADSAADFKAEYTWYFKTDAQGYLAYDYDHYVTSFTYNGKSYKSDTLIQNKSKTIAMLPFGFLKIKEIMPPSDIYEIDTKTYTMELAAQKDAAGEFTNRRLTIVGGIQTSVEQLRYWKLTVEKKSKASDEVLGLNAYELSNATFAVYTDASCTHLAQLYSDANLSTPVPNNVFTTDASGKTPVYYLKAGSGSATYYVKELTAPKGHQLVTKPVEITVTMPADALKLKTASFTEGFSEPYDYMELDALVEKYSMHGKPVKNVVFKVCYYDDSSANAARLKKTWYLISDENGKVYMDQAHVYTADPSLKSDSFYTDPASKAVILPVGGYLTIQEVKAPAQYVIDDTVTGFATKKQKLTVTRKYNDLVPCRIRLKKYDATGAKPLEGVQFELKFVKAAETDTALAKTYTRLLKEGETKILSTDKKGELSFDNLDQGTYEITEVKTVAGQTLLKDKITVELPITMTKAEADVYGNVDFTSAKEDKGYTNKWFFYDCLYEITNEPQFKIPQTGGIGDWKWGYAGLLMLVITGGIFLFGFRKKSLS